MTTKTPLDLSASPPPAPLPPPSRSPHQSIPSSPSLSRPRTPRPRNSPRIQPRIHRSSSHLSVNGATASAEGSPRLSPMPEPQHHRAPSLGELYQELESEQEGRVNRLLGMIRQQQAQLDSVSATSQSAQPPPPPRSRTPSISRPAPSIPGSTSSTSSQHHPNTLHHRTSITSPGMPHLSLGNPSIRSPGHPIESPDWMPRERERDELAYFQAEAASVQRENKMLKVRIVELERLLDEQGRNGSVAHVDGMRGDVIGDGKEEGGGDGEELDRGRR